MSKFNYKLEGTKLFFDVDLNEDGQPFAGMYIDILEIPDEVMSAIIAKKEEVKEE